MKNDKNKLIAVLIAITIISSLTATVSAPKPIPNPSADLDQIRNGKADSPDDPSLWANGNLNPQQSHYIEGYSVPYRVVMKNLPTLTPITLRIGFDITKNSKHALDYLTTYNYIDDPDHSLIYGHVAETIDPLADVIGVSSTTTTYLLPTPSSTGSPVTLQPTTSFNSLATADKQMTLFGGTITNVVYFDQEDLTLASDEAQVDITFTAKTSTAVLAWGGHIASILDWGMDGDEPRSASGISGSPYHTSLVSWSLDGLGQQDMSLKIDPPGGIIVKKVIDWGYYTQYQNGWDFDFTPDWADSFILGNGDSKSFILLPGTYSVTESNMNGWVLDKIIIEGGGYDTEIPGPTAKVDLELGEYITITFVNKPPDFVIPENPLGTLGSLIAILGAAVLFLSKQKGLINIVVE